MRNGFGIPINPSIAGALDLLAHPRWLVSVMLRYMLTTGVPTYAHYPPQYRTRITRASVWDNVKLARRLTWDDFTGIRRQWDGNLILNGVLDPADAERARSLGADGIVVSCHGGRNLDSAPVALDALPRISDAVGSRMTVLADSGIRRGSDIVKYVAAGANAVLVGRATLYGTAAAGEMGAKRRARNTARGARPLHGFYRTVMPIGDLARRDLAELSATPRKSVKRAKLQRAL